MKRIAFAVLLSLGFGVQVYADNTTASTTPAGQPASTAAAPAPTATIKVEKIAVGTAIDNKELTGEASSFESSVARLYAWAKVDSDQVPVTVKFVWSADGKQEAEVPMQVKYNPSRVWSSKNVWPGAWKVDLVDDKGTVLATQSVTVTKAPAQTGQ